MLECVGEAGCVERVMTLHSPWLTMHCLLRPFVRFLLMICHGQVTSKVLRRARLPFFLRSPDDWEMHGLLMGLLKKAASGVLAIFPCSRIPHTLRASKWLRPCWTDPSGRLKACFFEPTCKPLMGHLILGKIPREHPHIQHSLHDNGRTGLPSGNGLPEHMIKKCFSAALTIFT